MVAPDEARYARHLIAWDVDKILDIVDVEQAQAVLAHWIDTYYPEPVPEPTFERIGDLFIADRWDPPIGDRMERTAGDVWPGDWVDVNPFGTHYKLGDFYYYHPTAAAPILTRSSFLPGSG